MPTQALEIRVEELIEKFRTEAGKRRAISIAVREGLIHKPEYLRLAREIELSLRNYLDAANLSVKLGDTEKAIELYIKTKRFRAASDTAQRAGDNEKAIKILEEHEGKEVALGLAEKLGDTEKAKILYEELLQHYSQSSPQDAANFAEYKEDFERSIQFYLQCKSYFNAARIAAEKLNDKRRALEILELSDGNLHYSQKIARELGDTKILKGINEKLIVQLQKQKQFSAAGKLAEEVGDTDKAREFYKQEMENAISRNWFLTAADNADKLGDTEKAKALYTQELEKSEGSLDFVLLAQIADKIGDTELSGVYREFLEIKNSL